MSDFYESCSLCPRRCLADRAHARLGVCGVPADVYVARAALHMWEEPPISGERGSGAVFFVGCSLGCIFCQNGAISRGGLGKFGVRMDAESLADTFLRLQNRDRANNINLVTASHYAPTAAEAIAIARRRGLTVPVVWNSSGYESVETLRLLDGLVDVYLPDFKYCDPNLASLYSRAPDYPEVAALALEEMFRQVGEPRFAHGRADVEDGIMTRGVVVRHLVLPTHGDDSKRVIRKIYERFNSSVYVSIMSQYTPVADGLPDELSRPVDAREYDDVVDFAVDLGVERGFIQDGGSVGESFVPEWDARPQ